MKTMFLMGAAGVLAWCLCVAHALAMSHGPIRLDIKQVDGKPAACLPMSDDLGSDPIQIHGVGVSRATGAVSPDVIYWDMEVPASAQPVYLKRGECLVYGQNVAGAVAYTQPKTLDIDKFYGFSIIPGGDYGPVYSSVFCVLKQADGGVRIIQPTKGQHQCPSDP
ncbi:hypothetical protein [Paraburkholderia caffeinilytica]|uniref:hypothetical protein n=1 Tax=Paraburkholderia caffeinilytica TaxID=1761016 RepID=UPI003DA0FEBC